MAGLISDTLNLTSPTTTPTDATVLNQLGKVADVDPVVVEVEPERLGTSLAEGQGGGAFDGVGEADQLVQVECAVGGGDVAQDAAGADRGEVGVEVGPVGGLDVGVVEVRPGVDLTDEDRELAVVAGLADGIAVVTIDRPKARNAVDGPTALALADNCFASSIAVDRAARSGIEAR